MVKIVNIEPELEIITAENGEEIVTWDLIIKRRAHRALQLYREYLGEPTADDIAWLENECYKDKEQTSYIEGAIKTSREIFEHI